MIHAESSILERVHQMETCHARHDERLANLDNWVSDIHKSVKSLEKKASTALGALLVIEILVKFWK